MGNPVPKSNGAHCSAPVEGMLSLVIPVRGGLLLCRRAVRSGRRRVVSGLLGSVRTRRQSVAPMLSSEVMELWWALAEGYCNCCNPSSRG